MKRRTHGYSLIELLSVIAIVMILIAAAGRMFADAWVLSGGAVKSAEDGQLAGIIMKRWQMTVRETDPAVWSVSGGAFLAGESRVQASGYDLVFTKTGAMSSVALPKGAKCRFDIERTDGIKDCAVLYLDLPYRVYSKVQTNRVRIVGCGKDGIAR